MCKEFVVGEKGKGVIFVEETKKKIVVADDEGDIVNAIRDTLSAGYSIFSAGNGREAVNLISRVHPDLVIMDVLMPVMDGIEACIHVKSDPKTKNIPVLFLTAVNQVEDTQRCFQAGADAHMLKPFSPARLQAKVEDILLKAEIKKSIKAV